MGYLYINQKTEKEYQKRRLIFDKKHKKILSIPLFILGISLLISAIAPIVRFQFFENSFRQVLSPVSSEFYNRSSQILGDSTTDYTKISNWFDGKIVNPKLGVLDSPTVGSYLLSIPSLKIKDANVIINGQDLAKSLIHYNQTGTPGQLGNSVIFGHSVLPQFFNPKNYSTIFSTLYKLKIGDEIIINYDNVKYKYLVDDIYETQPTDLSVLDQRYDTKSLTIVTCHPPGTYLRRLIVKAKIVDY